MATDESQGFVLLTRLADEFAARYRRGERPSLQEYADRYPELAGEIRDLFPAMVQIEQVKEERSEAGRQAGGASTGVLPLQLLGDFRILREIGHGGMGVVYEAEQVSLGRHVALKVLSSKMQADAKQKLRFEREAKAAAKLHHTNIVPVFGVGEHEGMPYYVMQFIQGLGLDEVLEELKRLRESGSLAAESPADGELRVARRDPSAADVARSLLSGQLQTPQEATAVVTPEEQHSPLADTVPTGRLSDSFSLSSSSVLRRDSAARKSATKKPTYWQSVAGIGVQIADALEYAHRQGIQHRDIKPSNLLLDTRGTVWVTDFGLAKADDHLHLTQTGDIVGTVRYMPPEAFEGRTDARSDIYGLGLTLYELLAGRPAFDEKERLKLIRKVTAAEPVRLEKLNQQVPRDLVTVIHKTIDREPAHRYQTAGELAADLQRFIDDEPIQARRLSPLERLVRWTRHHTAIAAALAMIGVLLVALTVGSFVAAVRFQEQARVQQGLALEKEMERIKAVKAQNEAEDGQAREAKLHAEAEEARHEVQQNLYYAEMNLAGQAAELASGLGRVNQLLERWSGAGARSPDHISAPAADPRGWEWYYLHGLTHRDLFTLRWHNDALNSQISADRLTKRSEVSWSPDGTHLVCACSDGAIRSWDAATGRLTHTMRGHEGRVQSVAWSPNGQRLVSASTDGTIKIWEAATGREVRGLQRGRPAGRVSAVVWSPDGLRVASAGEGRTIGVWDVASGRQIGSWDLKTYWIEALSWSPDGKSVAASTFDGPLSIRNASTGQETHTLRGHTLGARALCWSSDSKKLASGGNDRTVKIWDMATGKEMRTLSGHVNVVNSAKWSPDGTRLATAGADGTIKLWDAATGLVTGSLRGHSGTVLAVCWSRDGTRLASAGEDDLVKVWDAACSQETPTLRGHAGQVWWVSWSPDGTRLASAGHDATIRIFDAASGKELGTLRGHKGRVNSVNWSPDGTRLASAGDDGTVKIWDALRAAEIRTLRGHGTIVNTVYWSPEGLRLASSSHDDTVKVWEATTGREISTLRGHSGLVHSVCWSPDGTRLVTGSWDYTLKVWDAGSRQELRTFRGHKDHIQAVSWSPDGKRLASASRDDTVRIWDVASGRETLTLIGHGGFVETVGWSPDGRRLSSGSDDATVKIWDPATGRETLTLRGHTDPVSWVSWAPDGRRLASSSEDGTIKVWDATPGYIALERAPNRTR